jgi:hypothetical protein
VGVLDRQHRRQPFGAQNVVPENPGARNQFGEAPAGPPGGLSYDPAALLVVDLLTSWRLTHKQRLLLYLSYVTQLQPTCWLTV